MVTSAPVSSAVQPPRWCVKFTLLLALRFLQPARLQAEDRADYRYEDYNEDAQRMHIRTHSLLVETALFPWLSLKGDYVYDGISGATPTGAPPPPGSSLVPLAQMEDIRHAGFLEPTLKFGPHTITPQVAYSKESDYESLGASLNYSLDLNQKNTTLTFGIAHNFDTIQPVFWLQPLKKDSTDYLLGVTQLLGPHTILTVNLTLGTSGGYQADPYRIVQFDNPLDGFNQPLGYPVTDAEVRPQHKTKQVLYASLTQYVEGLNGSAVASYRFYHDSFGIFGHTAELAWFQKLGGHFVVSPSLRYYNQTAAYFYAPSVSSLGDPGYDPFGTVPKYYSADYRLAELSSWTYGIKAMYKIHDRVHFDASYQRYAMQPNDGRTSPSAFPKANIFTLGVGAWF